MTPSNSEGPSYSFDCRPLPDIAIAGTLRRPDPLYGRDFKVQAKYITRWASAFFGREDNFSIGIPIGEAADVTAGEPLRLLVPDWTFHKIRWQEHRITLAQFRFGSQAEGITKSLVNLI